MQENPIQNQAAPSALPTAGPIANPGVTPAPAPAAPAAQSANPIVAKIQNAFHSRIVGQDELCLSMIVALIAEGHVLLESVPGLAKTLSAKTIAESSNGSISRVQCTPDLLPSDIIGTQIYNYTKGTFETKIGPVNANFVLLDEINRSSAKTQSAMLEAMQERQVSIGGQIFKMPEPFVVLATQNPIEQEGTYELPEAQLDRFLLKVLIDYPTREQELQVLNYIISGNTTSPLADNQKVSLADIQSLQKQAAAVRVDDAIKNYIVNIVSITRTPGQFIDPKLAHYIEYGVSPRGSIALLRVARALAVINGRDYVTPDDVKQLRYAALRHRIILNFEALADDIHPEAIIDAIFEKVQTP